MERKQSAKKYSLQNVVVIGASGYAGAELVSLLNDHPLVGELTLYVSEQSHDRDKFIAQLYPRFKGRVDLPLLGLPVGTVTDTLANADAVFLCTSHEVSCQWYAQLSQLTATVFDLSGGFRLPTADLYPRFYGFEHPATEALAKAVYGLAEWLDEGFDNARWIAVPGCYPTASLLALKPLAVFNHQINHIVINAVSGVTGAGRSVSLKTQAAELSLQGYKAGVHRHQPEIDYYSGLNTLFLPHLGDFKRGILATITIQFSEAPSQAQLKSVFDVYQTSALVHIAEGEYPALSDVVNSGRCHIGWHLNGNALVIFSAIDNLLKGAASQALQCFNLKLGLPSEEGVPL